MMDLPEALEGSNPLGTLVRLEVDNFTVFSGKVFEFTSGINLIIGENGAGKSHLLKLAYAASRALYPAQSQKLLSGKEALSAAIAEKLLRVFQPDTLGRLCQRSPGRQRAEVKLFFGGKGNLSFSFASNNTSSVTINEYPDLPSTLEGGPIFIPTREIVSLIPEFIPNYLRFSTGFDETYYDLCLALSAGLKLGKRSASITSLVEPLEQAMGGSLFVWKSNGHVYLKLEAGGTIEMPMLAEGHRKLAMLALLILNGSLASRSTIYWDEPETNLNSALMVALAKILVRLARSGAQFIIATHSLFLMREISMQSGRKGVGPVASRYISLWREDGTVNVQSADNIDELNHIAALDAVIDQDSRTEAEYWEQ